MRSALVPRAAGSVDAGLEQFSTPADGLANTALVTEGSLTTSTLMPSHLEKIRHLLLHGERRQAYHYALDEKLWAHAMVIASSINKEAWQEVASEFIRAELGIREPERTLSTDRSRSGSVSGSNGYESLRAAYSLYAGNGAASSQCVHPILNQLLTSSSPGIVACETSGQDGR